uniref:alpha-2-macroglobulin-like precursor n=1 Tax=Rhinatrema bivittatum TaxID=194408 RepID=UPI003D2F3166
MTADSSRILSHPAGSSMWPLLLLGSLLGISGSHNVPSTTYLVVIAADLHHPSWDRVCFQLTGLSSALDLKITMRYAGGSNILVNKKVQPGAQLRCAAFQVPAPSGGAEEVVNVTVSGCGPDITFQESKGVLVRHVASGTFVQTDKPIYKPGQKVNFRIVTLEETFVAKNDPYHIIELEDPNNNRIGQWLDVTPHQGIVDLNYQLASEPPLGTYTINVENGRISQSFVVKEYVLPKFEVTFVAPTQIFVLDETFEVRVCGRYTYGKPVEGDMEINLCRKSWWYWYGLHDICMEYRGRTNSTGCFSTTVDTSTFQLSSYGYYLIIEGTASLLEVGTNIEINTTKTFYISSVAGTMIFEDIDEYYHAGQPFRGVMKAMDHQGVPLKNQQVHLILTYRSQQIVKNYTTDSSGKVSFSLNTSDWRDTYVSLQGKIKMAEPSFSPGRAYVYYQDAYASVQPFYPNAHSYLRIRHVQGPLSCSRRDFQVEYTISKKDLYPWTTHFRFYYFVTGKLGIVSHGQKIKSIFIKGTWRGKVSISLPITSDFGPSPRLLVYILLTRGRVTADTTMFQVAKCFKNKVSLKFSEEQQLPGQKVDLRLQAAPRSLCAVRAVDQSVLLAQPEAELSSETIYGLFPLLSRGWYPWQVDEYVPDPCWGSAWHASWVDVFSLFKEMGLKLFTNRDVKKSSGSVTCPPYITSTTHTTTTLILEGTWPMTTTTSQPSTMATMPFRTTMVTTQTQPSSSIQERVRTYFPETWIWDLIPVGISGKKSAVLTVPDTITEWKASMFCTADIGFGLSPTATLTVFKPFFVEVTLPYSVVRGEIATIIATVFNYLHNCIKVQVTLGDSSDFLVSLCPTCSYSSCLCSDGSATFSWNITATTLGEVNLTVSTEALSTRETCAGQQTVVPERGRTDTLIKALLVRPEGVLVEKSHSSLLCLEGIVVETVSLEVPNDVVEGSVRASISVLGDIMGTALHNLDRLIQMPYGCGEQNMITFAPIIYVLEYLEKTELLTDEIRTRANGYLISGYQRELTYKHRDGSYSAFGESDGDGNTWLTAFVAKCIGQARAYIFIDDANIEEAVRWLENHQLPSGCFASVGKLFHTSMKGGVESGISLTAYVVVALLEVGIPASNSTVANGLSCITVAPETVTNLYTLALMAYALSLTGDVDTRALIMNLIDSQAIESDGQIHWRYSTQAPESEGYWAQPLSVDIELTAYVLLACLSDPDVGSIDMGRASAIVRWLTKQQNAYGGFSSTQDTVVALQALTKYASLTFSKDGEVTVTVSSMHAFQTSFRVDNKNRLLLQQDSLPEIPGSYQVRADGTGCVLVQTTLRYNIPPPKSDVTFSLRVDTEPQDCADYTGLLLLLVRVRYTGSRNASNMAIIEVVMLSGYSPGEDTERVLLQSSFVKKVEVNKAMVSIYLDELDHLSQSYSLFLRRDILVENLQPATVKVYDYYQPEENAVAEYSAPCEEGAVV